MIEENIFEDKESDHSYIQNSEIKQNKPLFDILNDRSLIKIVRNIMELNPILDIDQQLI